MPHGIKMQIGKKALGRSHERPQQVDNKSLERPKIRESTVPEPTDSMQIATRKGREDRRQKSSRPKAKAGKGKIKPWIPGQALASIGMMPQPLPPPPAPEPVPAAEQQLKTLLAALKKTEVEQSMEVQNLIQTASVTLAAPSAASAPSMQSAIARRDNARDWLRKTKMARVQLHTTWRTFIHENLELWNGWSTEFKSEDEALQAAIKQAAANLKAAKEVTDQRTTEAAARDDALLEISDTEDGGAMETDAMGQGILNGITNMVTGLQKAHEQTESLEESARKV